MKGSYFIGFGAMQCTFQYLFFDKEIFLKLYFMSSLDNPTSSVLQITYSPPL